MSSADQLQHELRSGGLIIRLLDRGIITDKAGTIRAFTELIKKYSAKVLLVDFRGIPGMLGFLDRYEMGEAASNYLPRIPMAVLIREEQLDPGHIGLTVAANRGTKIELFMNEPDAMAWFQKQTQPETS